MCQYINDHNSINRLNNSLAKYEFGREEVIPQLLSLINAVFDHFNDPKVEKLQLLDTERKAKFDDGKVTRLDILCRCEDGSNINVEFQVVANRELVARTIYYLSNLLTSELRVGEGYCNVKKAISILILGHNLIKDSSMFANCFLLKNRDNSQNNILTDLELIYTIELPKFKAGSKDIKKMSLLEKWCCYFSSKRRDDAEIKKIAHEEPVIKQALTLEDIFMTDTQRVNQYAELEKKYWSFETTYKIEREEGRAEGIAEGKAEAKAEFALSLLKKRLF